MKGVASACGSATVINAIATGKGAAFAIDLRVRGEVELTNEPGRIVGRVGKTSESPKLIEICARKVLEKLKLERKYGARIKTTSDVPIAVGLSSSSAAANAVVLATFAALGKAPRPKTIIDLGVDAAFEAGTTITGAFDDAAASFLGGGVITDNQKRRVLKRFKVDPKLDVIIYLPPKKSYTSETDTKRVESITEPVELAHRIALDGDIFGALTLNGMLYSSALNYDPSPALDALRVGALAAGLTGTGPAVVAISKGKSTRGIREIWRNKPGRIIKTKPSTGGAEVGK
jgi:shikimate kinase